MTKSNLVSDSQIDAETGSGILPGAAGVITSGEKRANNHRVWLFGAYTLLLVWGVAYLVLLFTDNLPS